MKFKIGDSVYIPNEPDMYYTLTGERRCEIYNSQDEIIGAYVTIGLNYFNSHPAAKLWSRSESYIPYERRVV